MTVVQDFQRRLNVVTAVALVLGALLGAGGHAALTSASASVACHVGPNPGAYTCQVIVDATPSPSPSVAPSATAAVTPSPTPTASPSPTPTPSPSPTAGTCTTNLQASLNATASGATFNAGGCSFTTTHISVPNGVTLANAMITYNGSAGAAQTGMIDLGAGSRLMGVTAVGGPYAVIRSWVGATNATIVSSDISGGPVLGVIGYQTNGFAVTGTRIHGNNVAGTANCGNECGGLKVGNSNGVVLTGDEVDHNVGPGIWADVAAAGWTISGNRVHDNTNAGIMYEISTGGQIKSNTVWENSWGDARGWGWPASILISSSGTTVVFGNTVCWSPIGISFVSQNRGVSTAGNSASGNLIAASGGRQMVGSYADWSDPNTPSISGNTAATAAQIAAAGCPAAPQPGH